MSITALYQILVDLGVDKEKAERALATLACEDQVRLNLIQSNLAEKITWRMAVMTGIIIAAVGLITKL